MAKDSIIGGLLKWGASNTLFSIVTWIATVGTPFVVAAMTAIAGFFGDVPLAYVIAATATVFAMTTLGLLRFDEWRVRRTAANKLGYTGASLAFDCVNDPTTGKPATITYGQPAVTFINQANFSISYVVDDMAWSVDGKVTHDPLIVKSGEVPPASVLLYRLPRIDMQNMAVKDRIEGRVKIRLRYGRKGKEHYEINRHVNISAGLEPQTGTYLNQAILDVAE